MFAVWFIVGLFLCLPASPTSEVLALGLGWESATATRGESATRWLLMAGAVIIVTTFIVALAPWTRAWIRGKKEFGWGLIFGLVLGSSIIWCLINMG